MKNKKVVALVLCLLLCVLPLTGCKKSPIQGDWADSAGNIYSFTSDMTFTINTGDEILFGGTFEVDEEAGTVTFTVDVPMGEAVQMTAKYDTSVKKTLTLTSVTDGSVSTLTRY
ncbi:MAG: hypothetical protein IJP30_03515 [Clostridia bacterium]|nr:hypothetical protein [Clostridia bacterium]